MPPANETLVAAELPCPFAASDQRDGSQVVSGAECGGRGAVACSRCCKGVEEYRRRVHLEIDVVTDIGEGLGRASLIGSSGGDQDVC